MQQRIFSVFFRFRRPLVLWLLASAAAWLIVLPATAAGQPDAPATAAEPSGQREGIVVDRRHHLMWAAKDNGADINWFDAAAYCASLTTGGYTDWRLPTPQELATLLTDQPTWAGIYLAPEFHVSDFLLWTSEEHACKATCVNFITKRFERFPKARAGIARALPVRSLGKDD